MLIFDTTLTTFSAWKASEVSVVIILKSDVVIIPNPQSPYFLIIRTACLPRGTNEKAGREGTDTGREPQSHSNRVFKKVIQKGRG